MGADSQIVRRIYGRDQVHKKVYLTRVLLTPKTPWGQLYFHKFHREDLDRDPHDHPFNFYTFPLNQSYVEEVFDPIAHCFKTQTVPRWRWSFRPAEHCHRVTASGTGQWPLYTLVWRKETRREWGFWVYLEGAARRMWTQWAQYVFHKAPANVVGTYDVECPGTHWHKEGGTDEQGKPS